MTENPKRSSPTMVDVEATIASVAKELGGKFDIARLEYMASAGYRLMPHDSASASVDIFLENDWLRVIGQWGTGLDVEFDTGSAEDKASGAFELILRIGRYGVLRLRPPLIIGPRQTLIPRSQQELDFLRKRYRSRILQEWCGW